MTKTGWIMLVAIIALLAGVVFLREEKIDWLNSQQGQASTTVPTVTTTLPYGKVTLHVGETAVFAQSSITLLRVFEDSRCPTGVTCIWAGTVKAEIRSVSGMGTSTQVVELGKTLTTEAEEITFVSAMPYPKEGMVISPGDYEVSFDIQLRKVSTDQGKCYVGGCSSQLCSDQPDMASTCEYRAVYGCYKTAKCERQQNGKCGWTQTETLKICLANPPQL